MNHGCLVFQMFVAPEPAIPWMTKPNTLSFQTLVALDSGACLGRGCRGAGELEGALPRLAEGHRRLVAHGDHEE